MKKNLLMMAAVMFGILIAFASCDSKKSKKSSGDDDEDETEQVEKTSKKDVALKKVASLEDIEALADYDLDDLDISELSMDDIDLDDIDLDDLTEDQANALLQLVMMVGNKELPQDVGDGMTMAAIDVDDDAVSFVLEMGPDALQGISISQFNMVFNNPEMKEMMMQQMIQGFEQGDENMKTFFQVINTANKDLVIKFKDKNSGESADLTLTAADLRRIQNQ